MKMRMRMIYAVLIGILMTSVAYAEAPVFHVETATEITNGANNRGIIQIGYRGYDGSENFRYFQVVTEFGLSSAANQIVEFANIRLVPVSFEIFEGARVLFGVTQLQMDYNLAIDGVFTINAVGIDLSSENKGITFESYNRFIISALGAARSAINGQNYENSISWLDIDFALGSKFYGIFTESYVTSKYLSNGLSIGEIGAKIGYEMVPDSAFVALQAGLRSIRQGYRDDQSYTFVRIIIGTKF